MRYVYLNGQILPESDAHLPVDDRSVLFGDAAYETVRSYSGKYFRFPEHLTRLRNTAEGMGLTLPATDADILRAADELLERNQLREARLRLTLTGGKHEGAIRLRRPNPPNLILSVFPLTLPSAETYASGVEVLISQWAVHSDSPLPRIKTVNRLMHLMAKEDALQAGAYESLFLDETGAFLEGTATNIFLVVDDVLCTPGLDTPILAGVTRDVVLEEARTAGLAVSEARLPREALTRASEAFLTGSTIELLPIHTLDGHTLGSPGPVWRRLTDLYHQRVAAETGAPIEN